LSLIRGLDSQRRLTIPQETLRSIGAEPGDLLKIYASITSLGEPCVLLEKFEPGCWICGHMVDDQHMTVNNHKICTGCAKIISSSLEEKADGYKS